MDQQQKELEEKKEVAAREKGEPRLLAKMGFTFLPTTWSELYNYAKEISQTDFVPDQMRGKTGAVLACWQKGHEVGLLPMASLQSIAIINGRPSIHSAGYWALITGHPLCEWTTELSSEEALTKGYGECIVQRRRSPHPVIRRFTIKMAQDAGLWGGTGDTKEKREKSVWFKYPGRMLQMRARHLAGDDAIPEAAQGLIPAEIAEDLEPRDVTPEEEPLKIPQAIKEKDDAKRDTDISSVQTFNSKDESPNSSLRGETSEKTFKEINEPIERPLIDQIGDWIATASEEEILSSKNFLTQNLKGLDTEDERLQMLREWNNRKQAILKARKRGNL